jgi:UDP-N-acetylmuramoyl-L-alanyl-D-glutamate--2,6-diaminopimelate ligase
VDNHRFGVRLDGRQYIDQAIKQGAVAVLTTPDILLQSKAAFIYHQTPLSLLGPLCSQLIDKPYPQHIALVTGTTGKTSTVNFCRQLWTLANHSACSMGNLGGVCSDGTLVWERDPILTVPDTVSLHEILTQVKSLGIDDVACEATSHALFDYRLTGVPASIGALTNFTRDHLDFHHTMEEYFRVKMRLFEEVLPAGSWVILNADDAWYESAAAICKSRGHRIISVGLKGDTIRLTDCNTIAHGQDVELYIQGKPYQTHINLFGQFQVMNILCALGIVMASGMQVDQAIALIPQLAAIEGRLNTVGMTPTGGQVIVDYANTPDGMRASLDACRSFTTGELFVVLGSNGERDRGKRAMMGEMAIKLADHVIVTDAQPRSDDPTEIRRDILEGARGAMEIPDRVTAIETACHSLQKGDTLVVEGMGHVNFRAIGDQQIPYSDTETIKQILSQMMG